MDKSDKFSRFVQFGADQDCHCGAAGCRRKLGAKPSKPKISSDAALKLVACQVAVSSPKLKAILSGKDVCICGCLIINEYIMPFQFVFSDYICSAFSSWLCAIMLTKQNSPFAERICFFFLYYLLCLLLP